MLNPISSRSGIGASLNDVLLTAMGLVTETVSRLAITGTVSPTSQSAGLVLAGLRAGTVITNLHCLLTTAGVGTAPTLIKMAILDKTGMVLQQSANVAGDAMWTGTLGVKTVPLGAPVTVSADDAYYLSFLKNGVFATTDIALQRASWPSALAGLGIGGGALVCTNTTGRTDYPANGQSMTPGAGGATSAYWFGAS
jgi:hypothetical protein